MKNSILNAALRYTLVLVAVILSPAAFSQNQVFFEEGTNGGNKYLLAITLIAIQLIAVAVVAVLKLVKRKQSQEMQ